jgi:hypothetical protein
MVMAEEGVFSGMEQNKPLDSSRIEILRRKISDKEYIFEAVQRIAQVLSTEISAKGRSHERKRRQ